MVRLDSLERFDAGVANLKTWLGGLNGEAMETWRLMNGDEEMMAMPRIVAIRAFLLNHTYHHRGQLSTYLRASGQIVPSVYGPTADDNPFG